ncbi:DNA topoisomerase IB [Ferruginibacter albus]|uniref:DNA topoisomerase IB n=1 Tax=Ferruginibacter albus TaxID=2875540 RepID=UPI001CC72D90|nr:DNA topoisomerase IB [Ferruginibacter albus]UAY51085.1 DNA topoisomerase IB [Ferruginibacter albus]
MQNNMEENVVSLPKRTMNAIVNDPEKTAEAIKLVYVDDKQKGITRVKSGTSFKYLLDDKEVKDKEVLKRIASLVIPPAWENVWICTLAKGHLQATGLDAMKRKQYKYHPLWSVLRNYTKFFRLHHFGKTLPDIRKQLDKDLALPGLPVEKVLAAIVSLMERTGIRIGNNFYEKLYGSFGLTTLKDKHVSISGNTVKFSFRGKKGVEHDISIQNKKLSAIVKKCRDIPGKELFQYYNEDGTHHSIDSGMVNEYIRRLSGADFTAKDFRTWAGTVQTFMAFKELGNFETAGEAKKKIVEALDIVAKHLGNTRTVCKKYYVHPVLLDLYENNKLDKYITRLNGATNASNNNELTVEEKVVMEILEGK